MGDLMVCVGCSRHIRRDEARCPFCAAPVPADAALHTSAPGPRGLSRAKLYALQGAVATSLVTAAACGSETVTAARPDGSANAMAEGGAGSDGSADVVESGDGTVVLEASAGSDGSDAAISDAADEDSAHLPPPPYGCVFPGDCADVKV